MNKTYSDYLFVPKYMFNKLVYPVFTSGTGYLVPWWALPCLYRESQVLPYFFIEDVFIGGFVAERCLVSRNYIPGYSPLGPEKPEAVKPNEDVLLHYVDHNLKHNIHRVITDGYNTYINQELAKIWPLWLQKIFLWLVLISDFLVVIWVPVFWSNKCFKSIWTIYHEFKLFSNVQKNSNGSYCSGGVISEKPIWKYLGPAMSLQRIPGLNLLLHHGCLRGWVCDQQETSDPFAQDLSAPHLLFKLCNESTDTLVCLKPYTSIRQRQLNVGDAIEKLRAYIS